MPFSMEHLDDRRPSAAPRRVAPSDDINWFPMVRAAFLAALTAFLVKLVSLGFFANDVGISLEVQFWRGFIPHLSMQTPPDDFARVVTSSTFVMAVVTTLIFTGMVLRTNADKMVVWGWFMGVFVTFETLLLELLRHLLEPPVVDTTTIWRSAIPLTAGAAIAVVYSLITRERVPQQVASPVLRATVDQSGGTRSVDARPAAFQGAEAVVVAPLEAAVPSPSVFTTPAPAPYAFPTPEPTDAPAPVGAGAAPSASVGDVLAAASVPNRIVDTRPASAQGPAADVRNLPPARVTSRPATDVGPAPIVDTRPAASRVSSPVSHGPNDSSTDPSAASKQ